MLGSRTICVAAMALLLSGCIGHDPHALDPVTPLIFVAKGTSMDGDWTAVIYRVKEGQNCMKFVWADDRGDGSCSAEQAPFLTRDPGTTYIMGGTEQPDATAVRLRIDGREPMTLPLVLPEAGVTEDVRYYATSLAGGPVVTDIEVLNASDVILESRHFDD
jgi:hypothetical protein